MGWLLSPKFCPEMEAERQQSEPRTPTLCYYSSRIFYSWRDVRFRHENRSEVFSRMHSRTFPLGMYLHMTWQQWDEMRTFDDSNMTNSFGVANVSISLCFWMQHVFFFSVYRYLKLNYSNSKVLFCQTAVTNGTAIFKSYNLYVIYIQ